MVVAIGKWLVIMKVPAVVNGDGNSFVYCNGQMMVTMVVMTATENGK